jgi:nucleotide-binding universal stress UspA family protein
MLVVPRSRPPGATVQSTATSSRRDDPFGWDATDWAQCHPSAAGSHADDGVPPQWGESPLRTGPSPLAIRWRVNEALGMKILVGVDGSPASSRAVEWCAAYAPALGAEVVVVHSLDLPVFAASGYGLVSVPLPLPFEPDHDEVREEVERKWCAPLAKADVVFRIVVSDGSPAQVIMDLAAKEDADLVVTGRRGRGGFAELLLGSTSHHLSHHLDRPLVIVP